MSNVIRLGDTVQDFQVETSEGKLKFYDWAGDKWVVLFCHPRDRTPVCTTELGLVARLSPEFERRNTKVLALSLDDTGAHAEWKKDIEDVSQTTIKYPIIADTDKKISQLFGMIAPGESSNETIRSLLIINPAKKLRLRIDYPGAVGRNFDEVLRSLDALQIAEKENVVLPANWKLGEPALVRPSLSDDEANKKYGQGNIQKTKYDYLRYVKVGSSGQTLAGKEAQTGGHLGVQPNKVTPS